MSLAPITRGKLASAAVMTPGSLTAAAAPSSSAAGVLALLEEEDDALKLYALQQLDRSVHDFWFQISGSIAGIEALYEDEEFSHRELAALVASKVRPIAPHAARSSTPRQRPRGVPTSI